MAQAMPTATDLLNMTKVGVPALQCLEDMAVTVIAKDSAAPEG